MNKKFLLTSVVALGVAGPAMAAPSHTGSFPSNGLMQEDYAYTNAATADNMAGVYQHNALVYANATYEDEDVPVLVPGQYLPGGASALANCVNGYYCPGTHNGSSTVDYSSSDQGIQSCPYGYNNSDSGAVEEGQCYKTCSLSQFAHASAVTGGDYYGYGADTCEPTDCVNGWHLVSGSSVYVDSAVGDTIGENSAYLAGTYMTSHNSVDSSWFGGAAIAPRNSGLWWVNYGPYHGLLLGQARLSSVASTDGLSSGHPSVVSTAALGTESGNHCYCGLVKYNPWSEYSDPNLSSWVKVGGQWAYYGTAQSVEACADYCSRIMENADGTMNNFAFRRALLSYVVASLPGRCDANKIRITWNGTTTADISANSAATVTYGGTINTPRAATAVPGKRFKGWVFSTTQGTEP